MTTTWGPDLAKRARDAIGRFSPAGLGHYPTPIDSLARFGDRAGLSQRLFIKRDDAISFGFGGNKVRKLRYLIPQVEAAGADTVVSCGGVQSNHARATAAAAARSGFACHLVLNGTAPAKATGNTLLDELFGATIEYVADRAARRPGMERAAARLAAAGRVPFVIPLGASTPHGALGYADAIGEMMAQGCRPDVIFHACSSGGTSAGLLAGCAIHQLRCRVIGISADDPPEDVERHVREILRGMGELLEVGDALESAIDVEVDAAFVGTGYGEPTAGSAEAQSILAASEAIVVDHTYTAKALAGLTSYCREGRVPADATVLFWHTGGQVALFA